mgnify:FL=1
MIFPVHQNLEQNIIGHLQKGPVSTTGLLTLLRKTRPRSTKQGMYTALRKLISTEIVLKHKKQISLNIAWLTKVGSFVSLAEHFYTNVDRSGSFLGLADGEKIKYEFRNLKVTDAFWNHVLYLLIEAHPKIPWLTYNPHCWFFLARPESERALQDFIIKNGGQYLLTVGDKKPLDRIIQREFDGKRSQYFMRGTPLLQKNNYYVSVIGEYIVEVWIDPTQAKAIEHLYTVAADINAEIEGKLRDIIGSRGRTKLVVSQNRKKAEKLRHTLAKPFYIPRHT